uniref:Uncharacterized protein n=1 Tax=Sonderella linearis TaxID=110477 RepID=A0A1Z1MMN3_9FLOR|nr:hypothetical protein [Sonderella linearis]ARW67021.1 hypothetical protein [Sonderella linearis]
MKFLDYLYHENKIYYLMILIQQKKKYFQIWIFLTIFIFIAYIKTNYFIINFYIIILLFRLILILLQLMNISDIVYCSIYNLIYIIMYLLLLYNSSYKNYYYNELNNYKIYLYVHNIQYSIPKYLCKLLYIRMIYIILLGNIIILNQYRFIINLLIKIFIKISKLATNRYHKYIIVVSFTYQFLEKIIINLKYLQVAIKIKYTYNNILYKYIYIQIITQTIKTYFYNVLENINYTTSNIWNRNIDSKNFSNCNY